MDRSCIMFNCLWQLWDWLDPPVLTSSVSMEDKKMAPPPQQHQNRPILSYVQHAQQPIHQPGETKYPQTVQYLQSPTNPQQMQTNIPNGVIHQAPPRPYVQSIGPRSPLLENHQELYGTKQPNELSRQYALREHMQMIAQRNDQHQQRSIPMTDSSYSLASPTHDPILSAPVPPGFNASVHQAYLRRNQHQLEHNQIYQNHQNIYQSTNQQPRVYQPYTSRIQQSNYLAPGHSHTQLLRQQYNELQQMKIQQQIQYQNQAQLQQQQTFAQRQILHQHLHSRQQSQQNLSQYDSTPNIHQKDLQNMDPNSKIINKNDRSVYSDDYAYDSNASKSPQSIQKQPMLSPSGISPSNKNTMDNGSSPSSKSPSGSESRRSSYGTTQALRSPIAQRPLSAPVTMAGWLYKQGSDGLKVWRKRWFVLTEYCLFYYKGQEEDKLLGSVLLPSYQVSVCEPDDKVLRKFAFKCEHTNMRTYILAAPDREQMNRWMKALTMATLMQEGSSKTKPTQLREQPSATNMEQNKTPNNNGDRDEISQDECGGIQPMYENAPPKPRRSNEGYNSPSPDRSIDRYDPNYDLLRDSSAVNKEQKPIVNRVNTKSPYSTDKIYDSKSSTYASNYAVQSQLSKSPDPTYNSHNLSLPLTNTATHRLENNQSQYGYLGNAESKMSKEKLEERLNQNKTPVYKDQYNDNVQQYYSKDEHKKYGETNYQKMIDRQDYNSDLRDHYMPEQGQGHEYQQHASNMGIANERRTPDTYGRSVIVPGYYSKGRAGDYEDIYNTSPSINNQNQNYGEVAYRRPVSPTTYSDKKSLQNSHQLYVSSNIEKNQAPIVSQSRHKKIPHNYSAPMPPYNTVPRPHSADFLEYEAKNPVLDQNLRNSHSNHSRQPQRPKSSLDINSYDYNADNYHYSEASYAEKMRQSAHYLRNKAAAANVLNVKHSNLKPPDYLSQRKMSAPTFHTTMDGSYDSDIRINNEYRNNDPNKNVNEDGKYMTNEISCPNSNWTLRNKSLSNIIGQDDIYLRSNSAMSEESVSASCGYNKNVMIDSNGDQFIRSASARLPAAADQPIREGERKVQQREESMKRLLEWKQRMLQSPLTRKSTPATLSLARSLNQTKAHQNQQSSDRYLNSSGSQRFSKSTSRIPSHHQSTYNSYSSDDEERLADIVGGEPSTSTRQGQAGRSPTPPPLPTPTVLSNAIHPYVSASDTALTHRPPYDIPPLNQPPQVKSDELENKIEAPKEDLKPSKDNRSFPDIGDSFNENVKETSVSQCEYTDEDLDEVLALYDDEDGAESEKVKGIESDYSPKQKVDFKVEPFSDYEICEINQPEIKDVEENINSSNTDNNGKSPLCTPNPDVCENHYLPMSPRKNYPSPQTIQENILKNIHPFSIAHHEDNSYVEMSHGIGIESAFINEEMQAYEVVCVPGNKTEPVYMELNNLPDKNIFSEKSNSDNNINSFEASTPTLKLHDAKNTSKNLLRTNVKSPLPDILLESQKKTSAPKSDSSDADDESSKDFSMEKAYSRFSLSDNFRPASYYLRSKNMRSDFQESSDSDIIPPPPPIPTSLPPMDEIEIGSNLSLQSKHEDRSIVSENDVSDRSIEKKSTSLMVYGNTPSMYDTIFKGERVKRNRVSLPEGDKLFQHAKSCESLKNTSLDSKSIPPTYRMSGNTDSDSLLSYNADRGSSRMSIESDMSSKFDISTTALQLNERQCTNVVSNINLNDEDDFVELRHSHPPSDAEIERMMKRRPLSEESCYDIESFDGTMNEESDVVNLDDYLKDLKFGSMVLSRDNMYQHSKIFNSEPNLQDHFLQKCSTGYLNERVAAIREEAQYENINLAERSNERCRSRNSNISNSTSDPETVNTFQTVYSLGEVSNSEIGGSALNIKFDSSTPIRSVSRNSLPSSNANSVNFYNQYPTNHTRHSSFEQPTISYYSKNTSSSDKDTSILKNLNYQENADESKVNVMEMTTNKVPKSIEELIHSENAVKLSNISHSRENSAEQSAPYYYSDLSSQDNLNISSLAMPSLSIFNKNNIITSNKLNNQRRKGPVGRKSDISHIHNPIHSNLANNESIGQDDEPNLIAAAARCVSMEFLSVTDKIADIDDKNIYESGAMKNEKLSTSLLHVNSHISSKNLYPQVHDKTSQENTSANYDRNRINISGYTNQSIVNNSYNSRTSLNNSTISEESSQILFRELMNSNNLNESTSRSARISNNIQENITSEVNSRNVSEHVDKTNYDGEMMWDEDTLWRENLRRVSHRHARSLDHLDCLSNSVNMSGRRSVDLKTMLISSENLCTNMTLDSRHRSSRLTRDVTYVNDNVKSQRTTTSKRKHKKHKISKTTVSKPPDLNNENDVYVQLVLNANKGKGFHNTDDGVYEQLMVEAKSNANNLEENSINGDQYFPSDEDGKNDLKKKFEIDREKLRQWDLMSSGLLKNESSPCAGSVTGGGAAEGGGMYTTTATSASLSLTGNESISRSTNHLNTSKKPFSGSNPTLSRGNPRDTSIPVRAVSPRVRSSSAQPWNSQNQDYDSWSNQNLSQIATEDNWSTMRSPSRQSNQPVRAVSPRVRRASEIEEMNTIVSVSPSGYDPFSGIKNLSAGELLGRTHEELVLLLIQLRRKHTATANAIEQCFSQIQSVQNRINAVEFLEQKHENLQRLEQLKHHLMELEKHYEKSKPLVSLVDNMVKLGTLYNRGPVGGSVPSTLDRLEYNQMIRERALMEQAAEQRRWAESAENLPREHVEKRVEELRALERWVAGEANTLRSLRQEREVLAGPALQHDLSRVHAMLAENSKKLEQTVAGNARLEQELMVLRQKLQQQQSMNARSNGSSSNGEARIDTRAAADATALLEDELKRVQQLVGDLQRQRQELSIAVRQLTDKSQNLGLISPSTSTKPTHDYTIGTKDSTSKGRHNSVWIETDLDNSTFVEHGSNALSSYSLSSEKKLTPLFIDTHSSNNSYSMENKDNTLSPTMNDDMALNSTLANLSNVEKQEIKTVRIVKRESERRQRDRERSLQPGSNDWNNQQSANMLDQLVEEENNTSLYQNKCASLPRTYTSYGNNQSQDSQMNGKSYVYHDYNQYRPQINPPTTLSLSNVNIPYDNTINLNPNLGNKNVSSSSLNNNEYYGNHQDSSTYTHHSKYGYNDQNTTNYQSSQQNKSQMYMDSPVETNRPNMNGPISPEVSKNGSVNSLTKGNAELSPIFTSEAARQIIIEMAGEKNGFVKHSNGSQHRRQVPKEKRRHYTAPHHIIAKSFEKSPDDDIFSQEKWWRARDDVDMERVLRGGALSNKHGPPPLIAPPDVVRSTLPSGPLPDHYSEHTIDRLLAAPNKIVIPERYVPEQAPELSPEEQKKRREKVESIKKMLTSTTTPSSDPNKSPDSEDKRQREHLLQLNQLLAKQVMEKSKIVAAKALEKLPIDNDTNYDSEDLSPDIELPLYQQRDNFFT